MDIKRNVLSDHGIKLIAKAISESKSIVHLDISSNDIRKEGAKFLFKQLVTNQSLTCLYFGNIKGLYRNFLNKISVVELSELLEVHQQLVILDLQETGIGDEGIKVLRNALMWTKVLRVINLSYNKITAKSNCLLVEIMGRSRIKRLNLSGNELTDDFKFELSRLPTKFCFYQSHLNLSNCGFTNNGSIILFDIFKKNTYLKELIMNEYEFDTTEFTPLNNYLTGNCVLRSICLKNCMIKSD